MRIISDDFVTEKGNYRPFRTVDELPFKVGDVITYRGKLCCSKCKGVVVEIEYQNNDSHELDNLIIGGINATPEELFNHYELQDNNNEFKPFGIKQKDMTFGKFLETIDCDTVIKLVIKNFCGFENETGVFFVNKKTALDYKALFDFKITSNKFLRNSKFLTDCDVIDCYEIVIEDVVSKTR